MWLNFREHKKLTLTQKIVIHYADELFKMYYIKKSIALILPIWVIFLVRELLNYCYNLFVIFFVFTRF